jgi:predicted GIY-YIG superfamily endonuclease
MYVYMIRCCNKDGFIKIGVAKNIAKRLENLQIGCPYPLKLIASIRCESVKHAYSMESNLHGLFKKQRIRGEWFRKVNFKKANEIFHNKIENESVTPFSSREWDEMEIALEAQVRL